MPLSNYDGLSNLTSKYDRNNNETQYQYDPLNRLTLVTYADGSTVNIQWDAGNRPKIITDSLNGIITETYDGLDRLIEEQSPQGKVVYKYNLTGPLVQMTVNSNPTISYTFDAAERLTKISQGSTSVLLAPDAANRPGTITYPNGVVGSYQFDAANQLLSLSYAKGATSVGNLAYTYDLAGRQTTRTGTLATLEMPIAVTQSTYDAANRLTEWNNTALTYDNNGNLKTGPSGSFTWNVRDQLTATGAGGGVFAYDASGRRVSATVAGTQNTYLYSGSNPVMISATQMLGGGNLDEVYAQVSSAGTSSILRGGDNSTVAVSNASASTTATYSYSPYGATTTSGVSATPLQFTGREDDGSSGLYYYRARYYSPSLGRFISQDPIGLAGGLNSYAYANGNPVSLRDPLGLWGIGDPINQGVANAVTGFGDGVYRIVTLGFGDLNMIRDVAGINGGIDLCSGSYKGGKYAGYAWGVGLGWAAGLNGGANSAFWAGRGASQIAQTLGTTIADTPIGAVLNGLGIENRLVWTAASATFAANADGTAIAVLNYVAPDSIWLVEQAILNLRGVPIAVF